MIKSAIAQFNMHACKAIDRLTLSNVTRVTPAAYTPLHWYWCVNAAAPLQNFEEISDAQWRVIQQVTRWQATPRPISI
jgi:hypothetical protein